MRFHTIILLLTAFFALIPSSIAQDWDEESETSLYEPAREPAATPSLNVSDQDGTYIIKPGDTLWDLAFQFLGDPFQWQRLWEVNRYIANPDLIYPGNQLQIPGRYADASSETSENAREFSSETVGALDETSAVKNELTESPEYPGDSSMLLSLRLKDVLSKGYLASVPFLWTEKDRSGNIFPGNAVVNPPVIGKSYQRFSTISFRLISSAVYRVNDTVDIYRSLRFVRFNNRPMNLVKRVGRACVGKTAGREVEALLFEMTDMIVGKERVAPATDVTSCTIDTLIDPPVSINASVFTRVEQTESPYPYQMIILDKGSTQGVELGDVFGIYHRDDKKSPAHISVIGSIGHVGAASSTLNMVVMAQSRISEGDKAVLLRRAQCSP
ncbi:MAG: LysM peptidoglycan-binding domain-containing protein [Chitinispirillaceae bacterium]|nr:LysM peptidoglycan-binding domain-containing protein [Chitinispirillaceae bacterium]